MEEKNVVERNGGEIDMCEEKNVVKFVRAGLDVEEKTIEEILEVIKEYGINTGGFRLVQESEIPKYVVITRSSRPGPAFDSKSEDTLITDGELEFISEKHVYNYPTLNGHYYKYKVSNATYVIILEWHGNDFNGGWQEWTTVTVYGSCPYLTKIKELQEELNI